MELWTGGSDGGRVQMFPHNHKWGGVQNEISDPLQLGV